MLHIHISETASQKKTEKLSNIILKHNLYTTGCFLIFGGKSIHAILFCYRKDQAELMTHG